MLVSVSVSVLLFAQLERSSGFPREATDDLNKSKIFFLSFFSTYVHILVLLCAKMVAF